MPLTKEDLQVGGIYRAKRYREWLHLNNNRRIVWMGDATVQYDSDTVRIGQHYPRIDIEKFLRWAKEKVKKGGK